MPPKEEMPMCDSCRSFAYASGSSSVSLKTSAQDIFAKAATITIGNINLMPNTAIAIPHVKKRRLQIGVILASFVAFITALSKDRLTSSAVMTSAVSINDNPKPFAMHSPR